MISIIIPTRNRPDLLQRLIQNLENELQGDFEIIIVDSSDCDKQSTNLRSKSGINYFITPIKSAAAQRNIGLSLVNRPDFIFFLDDDVLPTNLYFEKSLKLFEHCEIVGVSGVVVSTKYHHTRVAPRGLIGIYMRVFQLDSKKDGALLKSGVNIPVRNPDSGVNEVEWLIGCSVWRYSAIGSTRFESDFWGQSLGEDVIFSVRMRRKGKLVTDTRIQLLHDESEIERPLKQEFWKMWIKNRYRLISVAEFKTTGRVVYWWANVGQLLILIYMRFLNKNYARGSIRGLIDGTYEVLRDKN
jgi:glycosyltransferase involved in cell wall biosynthesis